MPRHIRVVLEVTVGEDGGQVTDETLQQVAGTVNEGDWMEPLSMDLCELLDDPNAGLTFEGLSVVAVEWADVP